MKRFAIILLIAALVPFLSTRSFGQMTGTYTVDPEATGGFAAKEFTSIKAAVDSLLSQGISSAVTIDIEDGEYTEQINMSHAITGSSAANIITFQSASGDSTKVIIKWSSTTSALNYNWLLTDADYVTFRQLTFLALNSSYGILMNINGNATNILVENCQFFGYNTTSTNSNEHALIRSLNDPTDMITIQNNLFQNGTFGVLFEGVSTSSLSPGLRVFNNTFFGQRQAGVYLTKQNAPVVNGNTINNGNDASYGVFMEYCDNRLEIQNNRINLPVGYWGVYLNYCDATSTQEGLVVNNFITLQGGDDAAGIRLYNSNFQFIYHNTVHLTSTVPGDFGAFYLQNGSNIKVRNNIFAHFGGYYAFNVLTGTAVVESDHNDYFALGNYLGSWNGATVTDLAALQAANLKDASSISVNPAFFSATDLHTNSAFIDGHGASVGITTDIDGKTRTDYDIGASEFTAPAGQALSGTYTVGGTGPDFTTITAAVDSVNKRGISSSVIFNVRPGSYTGQYTIYPVPGAGPGKTVTFRSESGDSTDVEVSFNSGSSNNYVLRLQNADYINIRSMSLAALNATYSVVIDISGNATSDSIFNCIITGDKTASSDKGLITSDQSITKDLVVYNNIITGGRIGVYLNVYNQGLAKGTLVKRNDISGQAGYYTPYGIYIRDHEAPVVTDNVITCTTDNDFYGIHLEECTDALQVLRNKVTLNSTVCGIRLYNCVGTSGKRGLTANNFIVIGGTSNAQGIYTYNSDYQNIFNNSVRINSTSTTAGTAFFNTNGSTNIVLKNNIFSNFGGGWALYSSAATDITESDYNDLYTTGNFIAYFNGSNRINLSDYQAASSLDAHSVTANPSFVSASDLHTTSSFLDSAGFHLDEITSDIDGQTRNSTHPDIGADEFAAASQPLAGTYTIGETSADFVDFSDAVSALNQFGISAPVIFNVQSGTYSDQFTILDVNGADALNTITFQSETGDSTAVELTYSANQTYNYIIELVGADYITFRNMTFSALNNSYSVIFLLKGGIQGLTIKNCVMNGKGGNSYEYDRSIVYSGSAILTDLTIENNNFSGGRSGIWISCDQNVYSSGVRILNNQFSGNYYEAIYLRYHDAPEVSGNQIVRTDNQSYYAVFLYYCSNNLLFTRNIIKNTAQAGGIRLYYCTGTTSNRGLIANNFIDVGGTSYATGIYTDLSNYQRIYSNSIRITSTHATYGNAFYNNGGTNIEVKNNILSNFGGGFAYYTNSTTAITASDYNDLFTTGSNLAYWNGANRQDLAALRTESGKDANSISANPGFVSADDMHTTSSYLDSLGTVLASVTDDIDGEPRNGTHPDIGADEFTPTTFPLSGPYTIGGDSPDYETFTEAVTALNDMGVSGPVVFNVRDGSYEEQISLLDINGADATNTITFQSESDDSSLVELTFAASSTKKYVVELVGTDFITFRKMTFSATNSTYSLVFYFRGGLENVTIANCVLNGLGTSGYEYNNAVLYSGDAQFTNLTIENNVISGGRSGVWIQCVSGNYATGTRIINNECSGQYYDAVYLRYHNAPIVEHNNILINSGYYIWGIYMSYCSNDLIVRYNMVKTTNIYGGIYIYYCDGTTSKRGLVVNNFVDCGGTSDANGISVYYSNYQRIYSNTVRITSTNTSTGRAFNNYNGGNIDVKNNIFANMGGGYSFYANNTTAVNSSDYNDLFTTGNYLAYWNGNRANIAELQAQSGLDANSISVNPSFAAADDIHTTSYFLDGTGTVLAQVTYDIDGETRNATHPDIGADEFTATSIPLEGLYTIGGTDPDYATFSDAVSNLNNMGVMGTVTFKVRNGTYEEHFELLSVTGVSATDTIVFRSESGDSSKVILTFNASSTADDYLVKLTGADYITFSRMTLAMTNSTYSTVIRINGSVNNLNILNNIISGDNDAYSSLIYSGDGNITDNVLIRNNIIIEGGYGINMNGNNSTFSKNVRIIGNILNSQNDYGIYLEDQDAPYIIGNLISTSDNYFYGIYLNDCDNNLLVGGNTVTNNQSTYGGIYLYYCNGSLVKQGAVVNNYVGLTGTSWATGIYLYYSEYQNIYYNSVNISSTYSYQTDKNALYVYNGDYLNVKNNIFACTNGGYAYNIRTTSALDASDYNNLYTTSDNIAYWNGDITSLSALKTASSMDVNSISSDPKFMSATSYIPGQVAFHKTATPIAGLSIDIEGHARDASTPDIGAYEFFCTTPAFNIKILPFCFGDSTIFIDKSTGIAPGSTISWDFDGDYNPEKTSTKMFETVKYLYNTSGDHTLNYRVQHFAGCDNFTPVTVTVNPKLTLEITTGGAYCGNDDGEATVTVTAGEGPYTYTWSNGQKTASATGLAIGTYTVAVTDKNKCVTTKTVEIEDAMQVTVAQLKGATCGKNDGKAAASIEGGEAPYTYVWSNGETNDTNDVLEPGLHYVSVIDNNGCYAQGSVNIGNDGTGPQISLVSKTDIRCNGKREGAIDLAITGGSTPYEILWSNGHKTEDIDSLIAGVYDIIVMDHDSCPAAASFEVKQPPRLTVSTVIENAGCALSDGRAVAIVSGGTEPYFYSWSTGGILQIEENLAADIYSVTVTDARGCQKLEPVIINNVGGPEVTIKTITGVTCADTTNGAIDITITGGTPFYDCLWFPGGETSQDITGLIPGTYKVRVTDQTGCVGVNNAVIIQEPPAVNELCLITVDSLSGRNQLWWERNDAADISHFNIYRESSQKSVYQLIEQVPVEDLTVFTDSVADPMIRSWKYRISAVDVCGNESELSIPHKTMHLTLNLGLINNSINLIWDHYEGIDFSTYKIWRYSSAEGWKNLDNLASTLTSFTDLDSPEDIELSYVVEVLHPTGCTATELKASTLNASRSNRQTTTRQKGTGVFDLNPGLYNLSVYPNPGSGVFNVALDLADPDDVDIRLFDISGKMVFANNYKSLSGRAQIEIDLSAYANGMYYMNLKTAKGLFNRILIKE